MTLEILLIGLSFLLTGALAIHVQRRPAVITNGTYAQLQAQVAALRQELTDERAESDRRINALASELAQERQIQRDTRTQLQEVLDRNRRLFAELDRQIAINAWRDRQLRENNLEPRELPEHLRESRLDTPPGIAIRITNENARSGVNVRGDIVGGDKEMREETK